MKKIYNITLMMLLSANMCSVTTSAQSSVSDDFAEGEFIAAPPWSGTTSHFIVNTAQQLQLNNTAAGTSYLSTPFSPSSPELEWHVYVRLAFAASSNNYSRIYLMSNTRNITQPTDGYYLQLGEAGNTDAVELFRQTGTTSTSVCRATNGSIASAFAINIKITRDSDGNWKLLIDYAGGQDFKEEATGTDLTYSTGQWLGITCVYSAGNAARFYFDNLYAGPPPDPSPPPVEPKFNDVVINEFFPDPSPSFGLPAHEFIEIYNRSDETFNLNGWKIGDAASFAQLPSISLLPKEYLIVTTTSGNAEYSIHGKTIGLSAFPSLNNSGDAIRLTTSNGVLVDSLTYNLTWYHESFKSEGGYTIERLNPEMSSTDRTNWYVAMAPVGGTPGKINSVFGKNPDSTPPVIVNMAFVNDTTIQIRFSETMDPVSVADPGNYDLNVPGMILPHNYQNADSTVEVELKGLKNGVDFRLTISGIKDLAGNSVGVKEFNGRFFIRHPVHFKDVIIHELMADPSPVVQMPDAEYVELMNRSKYAIDIRGWTLEDVNSKATLPSIILHPNMFMVLTSISNASKFAGIANVIPVPGFPSLGNSSDVIRLFDTSRTVIDSVAYDTSWYHNLEKSEGGWSLELIDIDHKCGEGNNWAACEDVSGGTPGRVNSINGNRPDLTPPKLLKVYGSGEYQVILEFNERLGTQAFAAIVQSEPPITFDQIRFANSSGRILICSTAEVILNGTNYTITVSNVSDCSGNIMDAATGNFVLPEEAFPGDIVINEILFNPRPGAADFIEIYNRSFKYIDMIGWKFSNERELLSSSKIITPTNDILPPAIP